MNQIGGLHLNKVHRKRVFAAVLLIAVALTTVAYASLSFGVDVAIDEVSVSLVGVAVSLNIPAGRPTSKHTRMALVDLTSQG